MRRKYWNATKTDVLNDVYRTFKGRVVLNYQNIGDEHVDRDRVCLDQIVNDLSEVKVQVRNTTVKFCNPHHHD